jgi:MscS family membrane protein
MSVQRSATGTLALASIVLVAAAVAPLRAQVPGFPSTAAPAAQTTPNPDALGRDTPFGTVTGFNRAVHRGDFTLAARFLQLRGRQLGRAEELARDLNLLLDRYYTQPLIRISSEPGGNQEDGLVPNHDQLPLEIGAERHELVLERVTDADAGQIWLFSSQSLTEVPRLAVSAHPTFIESSMPAGLTRRSVLGASYAQWIAAAVSVVIPVIFFWLIGQLVFGLAMRVTAGTDRSLLIAAWWRRLRWPLVAGLSLVIHLAVMRSLSFSLQFRYTYARLAVAVGVVIAGVLFWRLVSLSFQHAGIVALSRGHAGTRTLLLLSERIAKVMLMLVAVFGLLAVAGLDLTTALAGVGIAGVAIAFGAQKTVENLLGGVFLLSDRVIAVGDYCRLSDREGWIEDITLRSVRLRTLQQTLLSVPAGVLSQGSIENYSSRGKILIQTRLRLRYGVTVDQLQRVLDAIRQVVAGDARIDQASARVRLVDFSANGVEIELFAFVETGDVLQFLEVREQVLLRVAAAVESTGCGFAAPPQFMYGTQDAGDTSMAAVTKPT